MSIKKRRSRSGFVGQLLESRTLLSGWTTVDTYQLVNGVGASPLAMGTDAAGNVYAAGDAVDSSGSGTGIVRERARGSNTWTTIEQAGNIFHGVAADPAGDVFAVGGARTSNWFVVERKAGQSQFSTVDTFGGVSACAYAIAVDSAGDVFVAGTSSITTRTRGGTTNTPLWTVREEAAGQTGFVTVDNYAGPPNGRFAPNGIAVISSGPNAGVYTAGYNGNLWMVRKSSNGGTTWSTVETFQYAPNYMTGAQGVMVDQRGDIFVVGGATPNLGATSTGCHWLVRKSADGGASWSTIDDFQLVASSPRNNEAFAAQTDANGNVYVVGIGGDTTNNFQSIVRTNAGGTWHTIDDFQLAAGYGAYGRGLALDSDGNLYEAAPATSASGGTRWIVRELSALSATIATPTLGSAGAYSTTISFNRAITGFDLSDLSLTTPSGLLIGSDLMADGATLTSSDDINYVLSLPSELTNSSGTYQLLLNAAGSGITDGNVLPLASNALVSWAE